MRDLFKLVIVFSASFVISGLIDATFPRYENTSALAHGLFISFMIFVMCSVHMVDHGLNSRTGVKLFCAILPPIGIPYYFFKSFGFKQGSIKILLSLLILVASFALYFGMYAGFRYVNS